MFTKLNRPQKYILVSFQKLWYISLMIGDIMGAIIGAVVESVLAVIDAVVASIHAVIPRGRS